MRASRTLPLVIFLIAVAAGTAVVYSRYHHSVTLNWAPSAGATSYSIYRSDTGGKDYRRIGSTEKTTYVDRPVPRGVILYYAVKAVANGQESDFSQQVQASIPK